MIFCLMHFMVMFVLFFLPNRILRCIQHKSFVGFKIEDRNEGKRTSCFYQRSPMLKYRITSFQKYQQFTSEKHPLVVIQAYFMLLSPIQDIREHLIFIKKIFEAGKGSIISPIVNPTLISMYLPQIQATMPQCKVLQVYHCTLYNVQLFKIKSA